jgi:hypothetical protein
VLREWASRWGLLLMRGARSWQLVFESDGEVLARCWDLGLVALALTDWERGYDHSMRRARKKDFRHRSENPFGSRPDPSWPRAPTFRADP